MRMTIKDKIDLMVNVIEEKTYGNNIQHYEELLFQVTCLLESFMHSYDILNKKLYKWILIICLRIFLMHCSERII